MTLLLLIGMTVEVAKAFRNGVKENSARENGVFWNRIESVGKNYHNFEDLPSLS